MAFVSLFGPLGRAVRGLLDYWHAGEIRSRPTIRPMGIYDEQRMADLADFLSDQEEDDCDDFWEPDWVTGCDSVANHCESYPYN